MDFICNKTISTTMLVESAYINSYAFYQKCTRKTFAFKCRLDAFSVEIDKVLSNTSKVSLSFIQYSFDLIVKLQMGYVLFQGNNNILHCSSLKFEYNNKLKKNVCYCLIHAYAMLDKITFYYGC